MPDFVHLGSPAKASLGTSASARHSPTVLWLQGVTLVWMLVECGVSLYAAAAAHSSALFAFGADSLVELISATVVLLQFIPGVSLAKQRANRAAGILLFALASVVASTALVSLAAGIRAETSRLGIGIALAALIAMPILAWLKRREARLRDNPALAADAVQSATCAYLALITLLGLGVNAIFHVPWFDSAAALAAVPLLVKEGNDARRGKGCSCC